MKKNNKNKITEAIVGAGVAAASVGAYYLFGPDAKAHQKKATELLSKMKREVGTEIKKVKKVSMPLYNKAVDLVSENYGKQYKLHEKDVKAFAQKLKSEWKGLQKTVTKPTKKPTSAKKKTK